MNKISFSKCPILKHYKEQWEKLDKINLEEPVTLDFIEFEWSDRVSMEFIHQDTFKDFTKNDWLELIKLFYRNDKIFGLILVFKQDDYYFTTYRAYDWKKHNYYNNLIEHEFRVNA